MADKMMRVAGRTSAGIAKPLEINDNGRLTTSDKEMQRIQKKSANMLEEYYYEGVETVPFSLGFKSGNGTLVENSDYALLSLSGNPTTTGEITYESDTAIDLTNVDILYAEVEAFPNENYNASARFTLGSGRGISSDGGTTRRIIYDILKGTSSRKMTMKMNVSDLTGSLFVRIHIRDGSLSADVPFSLRIYSISGERLKVPSRDIGGNVDSHLIAKDYDSGNDIALTAVLDNENKAALRVIDAAPYGYDAEAEGIRSVRSPLELISSLSNSQSLAASASFETAIFDASALKDLCVMVNAGVANSPIEVTVCYYMSDVIGSKIKADKIVDETGSPDYTGASATFTPTSPFISFTVTNKSSANRTVTLQVLGGR